MEKHALVYVHLDGTPHLAGRLWARVRKGRESATFEYDKAWLVHADRFALEPALKLGPGPFHTASDKPLFGAIGDSAPDRWGRVLMRRAERRRADHLLQVSQSAPRRKLQLQFLRQIAKIEEVPEKTIVDRISPAQLSMDEVMFLVRLRGILVDDYFLAEVDANLAVISHGVAFHVEKRDRVLHIYIARNMLALRMVVESYRAAREVFHQFVVDFVREHLYQHIRDYVPSSTRQGRDALYRRLKENEELFRYEQSDFGDIETLLADYLSGKADLEEVLRSSGGRGAGQRQEVRKEQVGAVEEELPGIIESTGEAPPQSEYEAVPPIMRPEMVSDMKVLTVAAEHAKLNGFQMFLALSDRLAKSEGEFLRLPHTTKLMWGSHRVIYIFTDATGELSLYYDIKLREPLETQTTGGAMFPTTTIVTKDQIYVPVPKVLEPGFKITDGVKEFYVRFDTIP